MTTNANNEMRELTADELDAVGGGLVINMGWGAVSIKGTSDGGFVIGGCIPAYDWGFAIWTK